MGRDSSVGIATRYGLDGLGVELQFPVAVRFKALVLAAGLQGLWVRCQFQCPSGLRRGCAVNRLLRVRISPGGMDISVVCSK